MYIMFGTNDTVKKCSKCNFKAPMSEWKKKKDGSLYQLCQTCCEVFRELNSRKSENGMSAAELDQYKYNNDPVYREKRKEQRNVRNRRRVNCPECDKEMNRGSLSAHLNYKSCKGKPTGPSL